MKRVAVLMSLDLGYCRRVMSGILRYATEGEGWEFRDGPPDGDLLAALARWEPDGIIVHLFDRHLAGGLERIDCPVVNTTDTLQPLDLPLVDVDNREVGREAAHYFVRRGFRHFAYFGSRRARFSEEREAGYREVLEESGYELVSHHAEFLPKLPPAEIWSPSSSRLENWLRDLSKPVAIFCSNDLPARRIAEACARGGLRVPDEVAILGVDNDESECRLAYPALSSVDTPSEKIGYQAARMLASLMEGRGVREERVFLPPLHIVTRSSTDRWASKDPFVRRALDFIRDEAGKRIQVEMVAKAAGVSRRQLERLFKRELRRTVLAVIHESKTALAKEMLAQTDYRVSEVAERSGFADAKRLNAIFKKSTGMSPREFRKRIGA